MKVTAKHQESQYIVTTYCVQKREALRSLFFVCGLPQHARQAYHFVGSICLLCAFFTRIVELLENSRKHGIVCKIYKMPSYIIILYALSVTLLWSVGNVLTHFFHHNESCYFILQHMLSGQLQQHVVPALILISFPQIQ